MFILIYKQVIAVSNINELAKKISPSLYQQLKQAVETGKWSDDLPLSELQKESSLQLILTYQSLFNETPDHFTIAKGGELYLQKRSVLKKQFSVQISSDIHLIDL